MTEILSARMGPSRRDDIERKIMEPLRLLGLTDDEKYEDQSTIIHTFPDGWTIRRLETQGDTVREGMMMGNCIGQDYRPQPLPRCTVNHQGKGSKNAAGRCTWCNDTGYAVYSKPNASNACESCMDDIQVCSNRNCGNTTTRQESECQKPNQHSTQQLIRPSSRRFKKENGYCADCRGTQVVPTARNGRELDFLYLYNDIDDDSYLDDDDDSYYSLRDPNNVPKISFIGNLDAYKCRNHYLNDPDDGDPICHQHPEGCCEACGSTTSRRLIVPGYIDEIKGRGNKAPEPEYMAYIDSYRESLKDADQRQPSSPKQPAGQKTMQQMLEQTQKLLKRPMTPKDIEGLRSILSWKTASGTVASCNNCGSSEMNHPKTFDASGMSLCRSCGSFNPVIARHDDR